MLHATLLHGFAHLARNVKLHFYILVGCMPLNVAKYCNSVLAGFICRRFAAIQWLMSGTLKTRDWKSRDWKTRDQMAGMENAGLENAGPTKYGKPNITLNASTSSTTTEKDLHPHAVLGSSESQRRRPQQQALWCTHRLWQRHVVWWRTTWRWRQHKRRRRDRRHTRQRHDSVNDCNVYLAALSRLWHVATSVFVRPAQRTWNVRDVDVTSAHRHPNDLVSFLTFSWDTLTVHFQVDLNEFGVADFVPISTRFCMLSVCYCIILLAGCFLRTFLVLIFLHCCMFDNWRIRCRFVYIYISYLPC